MLLWGCMEENNFPCCEDKTKIRKYTLTSLHPHKIMRTVSDKFSFYKILRQVAHVLTFKLKLDGQHCCRVIFLFLQRCSAEFRSWFRLTPRFFTEISSRCFRYLVCSYVNPSRLHLSINPDWSQNIGVCFFSRSEDFCWGIRGSFCKFLAGAEGEKLAPSRSEDWPLLIFFFF